MRVLYLSRIEDLNLRGSFANLHRATFASLLESDPSMYIVWVVPKHLKDDDLYHLVLDRMPDPHRIQFVKSQARVAGRYLGMFLTDEIWYLLMQARTSIPYDVVLANQPHLSAFYRTLLTSRYRAGRWTVETPLVNWQIWVATQSQAEAAPEFYADEADIVNETMSSMFARNVWESPTLMADSLRTAAEYVKPAVIRRIQQQSDVVSNGVDVESLDAVYEARKRRLREDLTGGPGLFWGGRLGGSKRAHASMTLMEELVERTACRALVTTSWTEEKAHRITSQHPTIPVWYSADRAEFYRGMIQGDVVLCNSTTESYGLAWVEMLGAGMLVVFERAWWNEALIPDWYPFFANGEREQVAMAHALLRQWPDGPLWQEYVPRIVQWVREEHNQQRSGVRLGEILREEKQKALEIDSRVGRSSVGRLALESAEVAWEKWGKINPTVALPIEKVFEEMTERSETKQEWGAKGSLVSPMYLRRSLEVNGWRDTCSGPSVTLLPPT